MKKILFTLIPIFTACLSHAQSLYGTTSEGGDYGWGTICKLDLATNTLTAAFSFDVANGAQPYGSLIQASDGKLYGMTSQGGSVGAGVIFSYDPATFTYAKLYDFGSTNGVQPFGSLVQASDAKLYGMTHGGGSYGGGVIFSYNPATAAYANLWNLGMTDSLAQPSQPYGSLIQASDGKLYGMSFLASQRQLESRQFFLMTRQLLPLPSSIFWVMGTTQRIAAALCRLPMANYMV